MQVKSTGSLMRGSAGAAGHDLRAAHGGRISAGDWQVVRTSVKVQMPANLAALVVPRSGLAAKNGVTVLNAPGLIDPDYTGDIGVILYNAGRQPFEFSTGDRIAQLLFIPFVLPEFVSGEMAQTERGAGGFGSTGKD